MLGADLRVSMVDPKRSVDGDACGLPKLNCEVSNVLRFVKDKGWGLSVLKIELPRYDGGGPAGVKDLDEEGGGPAGVVEGFEAAKEKTLSPRPDLLSGVDGGLEEKGTWKPDIAGVGVDRSYWVDEQRPSKPTMK